MKEEDDPGDHSGTGRFPLTFDDLEKVTRVIKLVREQLSRMNPACLRTAASVLLALERLPSTTAGVEVIFNFEQSNTDGNWGWADIKISEDEFRLGLGEHFYDPSVGGDTETRVAFEAYAGEEQSEGEIDDWLSVASVLSREGQVSVEQDNSDYGQPEGAAMFGSRKRDRADREIKEIITWILGQSMVQGSNFPPVGVFETRLQMMIALEACGFFLHSVDRLAYRPGNERLSEAVYDTAARQMVRTFSDMIFKAWAPSSISEIEQENLDFFNNRQLEYGKATRLIGETFNDLTSASCLAAHNVARAAEIAEPNRVMALHTAIVKSLVVMDLANRIKKIEGYIT